MLAALGNSAPGRRAHPDRGPGVSGDRGAGRDPLVPGDAQPRRPLRLPRRRARPVPGRGRLAAGLWSEKSDTILSRETSDRLKKDMSLGRFQIRQ